MKMRLVVAAGLTAAVMAGFRAMADGASAPTNAVADSQMAADLQFMREEEKLALDVYTELSKRWNVPVFQNISRSEQRHVQAVSQLLSAYGIADPAADKPAGAFANARLQQLYDRLMAQGATSMAEAFKVGKAIEETDIADLDERIARATAPDVVTVFRNLRAASENHLAAFERQLGNGRGPGGGRGGGFRGRRGWRMQSASA